MSEQVARQLWENKDLEALRELLQKQPEEIMAAYYIGLIYYDRGDEKKAIKFWEQVLVLHEDHCPSLRALAMVCKDIKDKVDDAIHYLEKLDDLDQAGANDYLLLGDLYLQIGLFDAAQHAYSYAIDIEPDSPEPFFRLAILQVKWAGLFLGKGNDLSKTKLSVEDLLSLLKG
jgi:cytochrome c-type biogenesis protein CcmH/NrfG